MTTASSSSWEGHKGTSQPTSEHKVKDPLGNEGNYKRRPRYGKGLGGACWHMARSKGDSDQQHRLGPVDLGMWASERYLWGLTALQSPRVMDGLTRT